MMVGIKNKVTLWFLIVPDLTLIFFFTTTNLLICWLIKLNLVLTQNHPIDKLLLTEDEKGVKCLFLFFLLGQVCFCYATKRNRQNFMLLVCLLFTLWCSHIPDVGHNIIGVHSKHCQKVPFNT